MTPAVQTQLKGISFHLRQRRDHLLRRWREAVRIDPELTTNSSLARGALDDHIPRILEDLEHRLRAEHSLDATRVELQQREDAAEHGIHRWQQGYDIREALREWGHLHAVVLRELDRYALDHPQLMQDVMPAAREALAKLCMEGTCESASHYVWLQQAEAAGRVRDLEVSLGALQALENERAALLRETAHDLRGSVGVIANTTALLSKADVSGPQREHFYNLLQQRIHSMGALLSSLVELARLEAGQDPVAFESFDVAERIRDHCELCRPLAAERGLFLKCEGPDSLRVEGDPGKIQRVLQNLLLNALKATERGGVVVRWALESPHGATRWILCVEDTGPGFTLQSVGPLRKALKCATEEAHRVEAEAAAREGRGVTPPRADVLAAGSGPGSAALPSGEGIGLTIVKRLCEALGASAELETAPGHGTSIRINFPLRYAARDESGGQE